jgi:hydroxyacylglutathione hydrolase
MTLQIHSIPVKMAWAYLIESETGLVLIDTGAPHSEERVLRKMRSLGRDDLKLIFITHAHLDHYGSAAALRRLTKAPIAIHRADAQAMAEGLTRLGSVRSMGRLMLPLIHLSKRFLQPEPTTPDIHLDDGDTLDAYGLRAVVHHTPGHTPGSSCLLVEKQLAFTGDLLSTTGWPHVQLFYAEDWSLIPHSLSRIQALKPEWIFTGHGHRPMSSRNLQRLSGKRQLRSRS